MSECPVSHLSDADMQAAPQALLRAARRARELARQTGTAVVVMRDGRLVEERITAAEAWAPSNAVPEVKNSVPPSTGSG
jgi:LDH2 family malate/lactate/ureidoglycolate dehydrogenase